MKKGGSLQLVLNIGFSTKVTYDLFDILDKYFNSYYIHSTVLGSTSYIPIDLLDFKGITENELDQFFKLQEELSKYSYNVDDLIKYTLHQKIPKKELR